MSELDPLFEMPRRDIYITDDPGVVAQRGMEAVDRGFDMICKAAEIRKRIEAEQIGDIIMQTRVAMLSPLGNPYFFNRMSRGIRLFRAEWLEWRGQDLIDGVQE